MAGGLRSGFKPRNHAGAIILPMMLEKVLLHHVSRATAPATKAALEQNP